jgi:hypothetical protein
MTDTPVSLLGFEYQALIEELSVGAVPRKRSVGFQTTISKDCTQQELDGLLDKCRLAVTRQRQFSEIEALEWDFRGLESAIVHAQKALVEEDKKFSDRAESHPGRAERGLSSSEQKTRQDNIKNLADLVANRERVKERLNTLRAMVGQWPAVQTGVHATQQVANQENHNGEQARWADNGGASPA